MANKGFYFVENESGTEVLVQASNKEAAYRHVYGGQTSIPVRTAPKAELADYLAADGEIQRADD